MKVAAPRVPLFPLERHAPVGIICRCLRLCPFCPFCRVSLPRVRKIHSTHSPGFPLCALTLRWFIVLGKPGAHQGASHCTPRQGAGSSNVQQAQLFWNLGFRVGHILAVRTYRSHGPVKAAKAAAFKKMHVLSLQAYMGMKEHALYSAVGRRSRHCPAACTGRPGRC